MSFEKKCPLPSHNNDPLLLICYDEKCQNKGLICLNCIQTDHIAHKAMTFKQFLENHKDFVASLDEKNLNNEDSSNDLSMRLSTINAVQKEFLNKSKDYLSEIDNGYSKLIEHMGSNIGSFVTRKSINSMVNLMKEFTSIIGSKNVQEFNMKLNNMANFVNIDVKKFTFKQNEENLSEEMGEYAQKVEDYQKIFFGEIPSIQSRLSHLLNFNQFCQNKEDFIKKLTHFNLPKTNNSNKSRTSSIMSKSNSKKPDNMKTVKKAEKVHEIERKVTIRNKPFLYTGISGDPKYFDQKEVFCCFCKESSRNFDFIKQLGFFFGPYTYKDKRDEKERVYHTHELCALWTSGITMDRNNSIAKNLGKEVKRANILNCMICYQRGAGVGCQVRSCKFSGHFKCLIQNEEIILDYDNFRVFCHEHADEYIPEEEDSSDSDADENSVELEEIHEERGEKNYNEEKELKGESIKKLKIAEKSGSKEINHIGSLGSNAFNNKENSLVSMPKIKNTPITQKNTIEEKKPFSPSDVKIEFGHEFKRLKKNSDSSKGVRECETITHFFNVKSQSEQKPQMLNFKSKN